MIFEMTARKIADFMSDTPTIVEEQAQQAQFENFYLRTSRMLHGYLCRLSRDPALAEEVLQESYIRVIGAPAMDHGQLRAYLYATATNLLRDRWRSQKREKIWFELSPVSEKIQYEFDLPIDMAAALDRLTPQERAILWLAHVEELSHREIAAVLHVKEKSVRVMVFRAREKARAELERSGWRSHSEKGPGA